MSSIVRGLKAIGRCLLRRPPGVPREVLDDEGNVICVTVGRPLTAKQQRQVDHSNHRPSEARSGLGARVPSWLE